MLQPWVAIVRGLAITAKLFRKHALVRGKEETVVSRADITVLTSSANCAIIALGAMVCHHTSQRRDTSLVSNAPGELFAKSDQGESTPTILSANLGRSRATPSHLCTCLALFMEITYSEESPPVKMAIFISLTFLKIPDLNVTPFQRICPDSRASILTNAAIHP